MGYVSSFSVAIHVIGYRAEGLTTIVYRRREERYSVIRVEDVSRLEEGGVKVW